MSLSWLPNAISLMRIALIAPILGAPIECRTLRSLYLAGPARLLETISRVDPEVRESQKAKLK